MNFALIGVAGYIAPRHLRAIKETGNVLVAALDKNDSVGILDSYFPETRFFTEFERLDRHVYKIKSTKKRVDFVSITTPNYLHDAHIRFALRSQADAICEKPLVLNPWNLDSLLDMEKETGKKVYTILQLRLHPSIVLLKEKIQKELQVNPNRVYHIDLTYLTGRGSWYFMSWKGENAKSGGVASNIGVHFFDMLTYIFGEVKENHVHLYRPEVNAGLLSLKHAKVRWFLSVDTHYLPEDVKKRGERTYRSIRIDGEEIEFSNGFTDLHTKSYEEIVVERGFGIEEARSSVEIISTVRESHLKGLKGEFHPLCLKARDHIYKVPGRRSHQW